MHTSIINIIKKFSRPLKRLESIHQINYRYLLPESVYQFNEYKKYRYNDKSYDLYGWNNDALIDIYPTYSNIVDNTDLPKSWLDYINTIMSVTHVKKMIVLIYNKKNNKFINSLHFNKNNIELIEDNITHTVTNKWIKATGLKNFIMEDTILDILNKNYKNENIVIKKEENDLVIDERLKMGNDFESAIIDTIIKNHYMHFVKISESYEARNIEKYKRTLIEMQKGTPIIHQAVLHDPTSNIYGCVDLLLRVDWINKLFNQSYPIDDKNKLYYVVVDIKFHRLQYNSDNRTIRNEGMLKVFKSQLYIYNKALGYAQNYTPEHAFILGRGWVKSNIENGIVITEKNSDPFDKLGIIDFMGNDFDIAKKSEDGIKWINELNNNIFDETKPTYNHSYPNMNNPMDGGKKRKRSIAEENHELTLIGYIGVKHRKIALESGITNYMDENLNAEKLGLSGKTEKIINTLIDNQRKLEKPIKGNYVCPEKRDVEVFLDYEYMYSFEEDTNIPYLCGIGYVNNISTGSNEQNENILSTRHSRPWNFSHILLDDISMISRYKMCLNTIENLENIKATHIYTWSDVDKRLLINESKKYDLYDRIKHIEWIDMYKFCLNNYINFKGAKRYGLKEIGRALNENNLTDLKWKNNLSSSSLVGARKHYYKNMKWDTKNLVYYNEIDCRMIHEILYNLRLYEN
jgi:hypothetical protein